MATSENSAQDAAEIETLRSEVARLRSLVGPSEASYSKLAQDALGAREVAMRAELDAGRARARVVELENEVRRWQRDFVWFRDGVVRRVPLAQPVLLRLMNVKSLLRPIVGRFRSLRAKLRS